MNSKKKIKFTNLLNWGPRFRILSLTWVLIVLNFGISNAQFVNEWIHYNQVYVTFKVTEDGLYRIPKSTLTAAHAGFVNVNPKNLQVFSKGVEQAIYVHGENDLSFDSGDYIELYCRKNDGSTDSAMYVNLSEQNNPYSSQISDTIYYYVTWENSPTVKKRVSTYLSDDYAAYPQQNSVLVNDLVEYKSAFYWGQRVSPYSSGKGWFDASTFLYDQPIIKSFNVSKKMSDSQVEVHFSVCGAPNSDIYSYLQHNFELSSNNVTYYQANYVGYSGIRDSFLISSSNLPSSSLDLKFSALYNLNGQVDRNTIAYVKLAYYRSLDLSGLNYLHFKKEISSTKKFITFQNFTGTAPVLYDATNNKRTLGVVSGAQTFVTIEPAASPSEMIISTAEGIRTVSKVERVMFTNYGLLSTHPDYVIVYHSNLSGAVAQYETYRNSKGYHVIKAEINDLYHQFGYGVPKNPLAISRFIQYLEQKYEMPKYLLLAGKSISTAQIRNDTNAYEQCLIPTMGNPPSDNLMGAVLSSDKLNSPIAIGRVAARTHQDLLNYLDKVQAYESVSPAIWQKNALHFGGGGNTYEQQTFKNYLLEYESLYEDTLMGGHVSTFLKNSSDPIQISVSDSVEGLINQGTALLNFFGHGSSSGFDQNIDEPENYNNEGKYPIILANSCLSGDIHQNSDYWSISEKWVLTPHKGSVAFLASSDLGYSTYLHLFSKEFYKSLSYRTYGQTIGQINDDASDKFTLNQSSQVLVRKTLYDHTLHGDPALKLYSFSQPDLQISASGIALQPQQVTTDIDSFAVQIRYNNEGLAFSDSFLVTVERILPNNQSFTYQFVHQGALYETQFEFKMPTNPIDGAGLNQIIVRLDALNSISEWSETNNTASLSFVIISGDILPVYPYEYAVIPNDTVRLIASTGDPFLNQFNVTFQFDTTDGFNSPLLIEHTQEGISGVNAWKVPSILSDSTVYFWRVKKQGGSQWRTSSFRYISGQTGWSQAHHFQYEKDNFQFIDYNKNIRQLDFITTPKTLLCRNIGSCPIARLPELGYWIDGDGDYGLCGPASAFTVVVIDSLNLSTWFSDKNDFGQRDFPKCYSRSRPDHYFQYTSTDTTSMEDMAAFINSIPDGQHVLIYSIWNGNFAQLPEVTKLAFEQLYPSSQLRMLDDNIPYILYVQKGKQSTAQERFGTLPTDEISLEVSLKTNFDYGYIGSTLVGPASQWGSFHWKYDSNFDQSRTQIQIQGSSDGTSFTTLKNDITKDSLNVYHLGQYVDAQQYPYVKLLLYTKDSLTKVPCQINDWTLIYNPVPETAISPNLSYWFSADTVQQGEDMIFGIGTQNISPYPMDSLYAQFFVRMPDNSVQNIKSHHLRPHPAGDLLSDTARFNTLQMVGLHSVWVEFNGIDSVTGQFDQLEQHHFNNIAVKYFYVASDQTNPLLNVTFDGVHIMDGDMVSPKPEIVIKLKDENQYLALDDPNLIRIYLKSEAQDEEQAVEMFDSLSVQQLFWTPSTLPDNVAEMWFTPSTLPDGLYTLRVGATDASNNESGRFDYKINFRVQNKQTISEVLNYPNPFSTSTRFVFTLTGQEVPDELVIQIMTITGKVVKEIDLTQEAHLRIGRNITDYAWDGRDNFGDLLANGVYFYRVWAKSAGGSVELQTSEASTYFKKGIGKMYIIR